MTHPHRYRDCQDLVYRFDQCTPPVYCVFVDNDARLFMDDKIECQIERNGWAVIMDGKVYAQGIERDPADKSRGAWFSALDIGDELAHTQARVNQHDRERQMLLRQQRTISVAT